MKGLIVLLSIFVLLGCASSPKIDRQFSNQQYKRVMLSKIQGDTSDYVAKRLAKALNSQSKIEVIGPAELENLLLSLGIKVPSANASMQELAQIAKQINAEAFFTGRVRSGAMAISESTTIHSTIELKLIDTQSNRVITEFVEEDTSVSRMMLSSKSLENVSSTMIAKYQAVFEKLSTQKP